MADINPWQFSTKQFDSIWGLIHYEYRPYSPNLHIWLSRDPLEEIQLNLQSAKFNQNNFDYLGLEIRAYGDKEIESKNTNICSEPGVPCGGFQGSIFTFFYCVAGNNGNNMGWAFVDFRVLVYYYSISVTPKWIETVKMGEKQHYDLHRQLYDDAVVLASIHDGIMYSNECECMDNVVELTLIWFQFRKNYEEAQMELEPMHRDTFHLINRDICIKR